jgi:DNA-binding phage protein|uniref:Transcriptional regulator, XRE family n=1 Tax=Leptospirillum ferrodiazotrophum TaxID=412449 RepID=C6I0Y8_9BACT|nr:MAG: transcriptional regulator, XRE family [Leptospirillum ferrodiazotrophum]
MMSSCAHSIQMRRTSLGISQVDVAKQAGISRATLIKLEAGGDVSVKTLLAVLRVLGLDMMIVRSHPKDGDMSFPGPPSITGSAS